MKKVYNALDVLKKRMVLDKSFKEKLKRDYYKINRSTNVARTFYIILIKTDFGKHPTTICDVVKFQTEYRTSLAAEAWSNINLLNNDGFISVVPKEKNNKVKTPKKIYLTGKIYVSFLFYILNNFFLSIEQIRKYFDFIKEEIHQIPLEKLFVEQELKDFIENPSTNNNPLTLAVNRFWSTSYVIHKQLESSILFDYREKFYAKMLKSLLRKNDMYLASALNISTTFDDVSIIRPNEDMIKNMESIKDFINIWKNDTNSIVRNFNEIHWNKIISPSLKLSKEYLGLINKMRRKNLNGAVEAYSNISYLPTSEEELKKAKIELEKFKKENSL